MQDASAQTALLQFMGSKRKTTAVPSSVHCDHLIEANQGASKDLDTSLYTNKEVFDFLQSCSKKYGIDFWGPGSGIIHQIVLENYARPGGLMLGTDSHTPNAGGLGMLAIGVGGADAVDAMAGLPWSLKTPKVLGIKLTGKLPPWTYPKDIILHLVGLLTVQGGTNHILEYFGPGLDTLSCTGMATICNMGAEVGATCSVFPYREGMDRYLTMMGRHTEASEAKWAHSQNMLSADEDAHYDRVIEVNLDTLEPYINGPFSPDLAYPLSKFQAEVVKNGWPTKLSTALIGSCTNSSYQDMSNVADIARQALHHGVKTKTEFLITPGSEQIRGTIERDGFVDSLETLGGVVLANACGPCIGQWKRDVKGDNVIVSSFNRNFRGRNDGSGKTMNFLASPEIVTAMALAGTTCFDPRVDSLEGASGRFMLDAPEGLDTPPGGFLRGGGCVVSEGGGEEAVIVREGSDRLQVLEPFKRWDGQEVSGRLLVKVSGKCTTDHISAAGAWLKYKGHLGNISRNTLIGATNAFSGIVNSTLNPFTGKFDTIPNVGFVYREKGVSGFVVGGDNFGEGSAREHAAMQPRYLGVRIVITKSFARIHETNLKKQGVLPLTFVNPSDYDLVSEDGRLETRGVVGLEAGSEVVLIVNGGAEIRLKHSLNAEQIEWFKAGSALNLIAASVQ